MFTDPSGRIGVAKFHFHWVSHALSSNQMSERVTYSRLLLEVLEKAQRTGFERMIIGDESRFFPSYPHNSVWATAQDELPERVSPKIDTEKCLISVFWSVKGIHSLLDVSKRSTYNTAFSCDQVIPSSVQGITSRGHRKTLQGFLVRFDNAGPRNSRRSRECLGSYRATRL
jgi:hypothetical protein